MDRLATIFRANAKGEGDVSEHRAAFTRACGAMKRFIRPVTFINPITQEEWVKPAIEAKYILGMPRKEGFGERVMGSIEIIHNQDGSFKDLKHNDNSFDDFWSRSSQEINQNFAIL